MGVLHPEGGERWFSLANASKGRSKRNIENIMLFVDRRTTNDSLSHYNEISSFPEKERRFWERKGNKMSDLYLSVKLSRIQLQLTLSRYFRV